MQVDVGGQHSDIGRTFAIAPSADQLLIYAALRDALAAAEAAVRPGATFQQVYAAGTEAMRAKGFANYSRGHLGHSIGLAHNYEEPPFIAPDETRPIVPGMAISVELPYYVLGVGAFQLERMLLVTDDGHEALDDLPFALAVEA
jgi:Xaa-Pro aminopeptidase